jgi:hypothetical protein
MPNLYLFDSMFENLGFPTWIGTGTGILTMLPIAVLLSRIFEKQAHSKKVEGRLKRIQFRTSTIFLCAFAMLTLVTVIIFKSDLIAKRIESSSGYAGWADPECQRDSFNGPPCEYLTKNSREILLIGDSRAGMLSSTLIDVARELRMSATIWTHSGCRFSLTQSPGQAENCENNSVKAFNYIKANRPDHVILSQALSYDEPIDDLLDSIDRVRALGIQVSVITPIPVLANPKFNHKGSLLIPIDQPLSGVSMSGLDDDSMVLREQYIRAIQGRGIDMVDPFDVLCDESICLVKKGDLQFYKDNNHLTPAGAELLKRLLLSQVEKIR